MRIYYEELPPTQIKKQNQWDNDLTANTEKYCESNT